jgi:HNH endonuclease
MNGFFDELRYHSVMLRKSNDQRSYRRMVHRLVAEAFLVNPYRLSDVAHNDGNPSNNRVDNLRWSTHRDNQMDMRRHGTMQDGEACITCKITAEQAKTIRERAKVRGEGVKLAAEFGLSKAQISRIKNNRRWQSV